MNKYMLGDVISGKGTLKEIVNLEEDLPRKFRVSDAMESTTFEVLWAMLRRHAQESAVRKEAIWNEIAALTGYKNLAAAHGAGLSFEIDYDNDQLLVFERKDSPAQRQGKDHG